MDVFIDEEAPGCLWCLAAGSYKYKYIYIYIYINIHI